MGRYAIAGSLGSETPLAAFYEYRWALVPNLGVDLLVVPLASLIGVEAATKLVVLLIPPLTLAGFLWAAREAHGRLPASWLFAAPLIYGFPFLYGFVNFTLSVALAFLALGLWMRLGRQKRLRLRAALFVPLALAIWAAHAFGWGMLGLMAFGVEAGRRLDDGERLAQAVWRGALSCLPLAAPLLPMLIWRAQAPTVAGDWFNMKWKVLALISFLRDRWFVLDAASACAMFALIAIAVRETRLQFSRPLALAALLLLAAFLLLPRLLLGGSHSDNRLVPYFIAVAILSVRPSAEASRRFTAGFAAAALLFFGGRMSLATASAWAYGRSFEAELAALDRLPRGARVAAFVGVGCSGQWGRSRHDHLPAMAIVRREAFSNDQWTVGGSHLLRTKPPYERWTDPSHMVAEPECKEQLLAPALARVTPALFDHVWLIHPPRFDPALTRGWQPVWRQGQSILYRLPRQAPAAE
jgi:hypothetical protein